MYETVIKLKSFMRLFQFSLLLLIIALFFSSCKATKKVGGKEVISAETLKRDLIKNQVRAEGIDARAKVRFKDGSMSQSATATIKMITDSLVWMSVRKFGFEVARAQITADSVYFVDRFNRQYAIEDLSFLSETYGLPASLETLQAVLLGNPVFFSSAPMRLERAESYYKLSSEKDIKATYWIGVLSRELSKINFEQPEEEQQIEINLLDYKPLSDSQLFSYLRKMNVNSSATGEIELELEFTDVKLDQPKSIRFEIPNNYSKIE